MKGQEKQECLIKEGWVVQKLDLVCFFCTLER
jgi:hypothetical protein